MQPQSHLAQSLRKGRRERFAKKVRPNQAARLEHVLPAYNLAIAEERGRALQTTKSAAQDAFHKLLLAVTTKTKTMVVQLHEIAMELVAAVVQQQRKAVEEVAFQVMQFAAQTGSTVMPASSALLWRGTAAGEDPATCAIRQSFSLPTNPATTVSAANTPSLTTATTNLSSIAISATTTVTTSAVQFTGAASRKDSAAGAILGALGLLAALISNSGFLLSKIIVDRTWRRLADIRPTMPETIKLAEYLFSRLSQLGAHAVHGVPGDFNLDLLDYVEPSGLLWVGNANELNAGYAADGYSRIRGIGALVTTFGVGELSAINAIAGAYAERAPLIHIVGTPSRTIQDGRIQVHHTFNDGNFRRFAQMHAHVTVAQTSLRDPLTAPQEIDRVLQQCLIHSRPVYIEVPVDLVNVPIRAADLRTPIMLPEPLETPAVGDAINEVLDKLYAAQRPIILFDGECRALNIVTEVQSIMKATQWPTWTTAYGRGLIDESLPNFQGVYKGSFDDDGIQEFFKQADLVMVFGPHFSTTNSYALTAKPKPETSIVLSDNEIRIGNKILYDIPARLAVNKLRTGLDTTKIARYSASDLQSLGWHEPQTVSFSNVAKDEAISHSKLWNLFASFIRSGDIVMGETGTSGYGVREMRTPPNVRIFAPVTWLSIGYMLPAAQGAALAQRQMRAQADGALDGSRSSGRTILFIGDGSLQMTVQEISTMIRHNLDIIIVVLNNDGYTIERAIHGLRESYNDVAAWRYLAAPHFFGAKDGTFTAQARTWGELEKLLASPQMSDGTGLRMIELFLDREDVPKGPLTMLMGQEQKRMERLKSQGGIVP
ncbi:hypothetical protein OPT61_g3066 [Boeremia exigua]|uniref:Uncharacterized protein n=1 Tax=Boeremia exigua TaxID=749465 RepID=A0ACC2IJD9_9PLEO|nr:hypothetical protein OPT61_g3066 [Boeremia exigua]